MKLDLLYSLDRDEWCVVLDGACIVGFAGPGARQRAEADMEQLDAILHAPRIGGPKGASMANGKIVRVVRDKGFGFIRDERGQELFFHRTAVDGDFNRLNEGQSVAFEEETSPKGPRAGRVRLEQ
jgi:CspA family cold shock protein